MATATQVVIIVAFSYIFSSIIYLWNYKPPIHPTEQKALYNVLNSINPDFPWTTRFPGDLCRLPPPGVVCRYSYFDLLKFHKLRSHIEELHFGNYVSDETPTLLPCSSYNATLNPLDFTPFNYLRLLTFRECFNNPETPVSLSLSPFPPTLERLLFFDNPSTIQVSISSVSELRLVNKLMFGTAFGKKMIQPLLAQRLFSS